MNRLLPLRALVLVAALLIGSQAAAQQPPAARMTPQGVVVDFEDADIRTVLTALAEAADLNVVFADLPARRITLRLRQPVPADSVRVLLRTIAEANGIQVVDEGGMLRFTTQRPAELPQGAQALSQEPRLFVYRLRHANAMRLASTLQGIFGGSLPEAVGLNRTPLSQRLRDQRIPPTFLDTIDRRPRLEQPETPGPTGVVSQVPQGEVQIIPDETTNSLLVRASQADWDVIQQAVAALDLRPSQVLIEVLIAEVRRTNEYEVSMSGKATRSRDRNTSAELRGVTTGDLLLRWMNGGRVELTAALSLLATRGDVRILSRPVLLAQNNQEARILIGSQRPFVQVFRSLPTDAGVRDQIVQYRDVGTSLTILPTINPDGYVNLQLTQEVSSATNETQFGAPVISTREASTNLFVRDGQTTVIGGLIDRQGEKTRTGIPLLIDIPVIGGLFGTTRNSTTVSELFLFLTPHVVQSDADVDRMREGVEKRLELLDEELRKAPPIQMAPTQEPVPEPER